MTKGSKERSMKSILPFLGIALFLLSACSGAGAPRPAAAPRESSREMLLRLLVLEPDSRPRDFALDPTGRVVRLEELEAETEGRDR